MEFKNYYQTLGVEKTASADEIKKAYRKLARKYHPDVSKEPDAEKHMRDLNEAKEVLGDNEKRAAYDQLSDRHQAGDNFRPSADWDSGFARSGRGFSGQDTGDFSDFFANIFGHNENSQQGFHQRGEDRHAKIFIDVVDSYHGTTQTISLQSRVLDEQGRTARQEQQLKVNIPKGVKEGQHIRLKGKGTPGTTENSAGDLYLEIHFKPHLHYSVNGIDVNETLPITPWEAALGGVIEAPTPSGNVKVTIPAGSQTGRKLRLKGRGIPALEPGDLYLILEVVLPSAESSKARALYETMARELEFNPRLKMHA